MPNTITVQGTNIVALKKTPLLGGEGRVVVVAEDTPGAACYVGVGTPFTKVGTTCRIVNPDTRGELRLDDCGANARDIAALLFAPGAGLSGQDRSTANAAVRYAAVNYLEGQNATRGDGCFGSLTSPIATQDDCSPRRATWSRPTSTPPRPS